MIKMNKIMKIIVALLIATILVSFTLPTFAAKGSDYKTMIEGVEQETSGDNNIAKATQTFGGKVLRVVQVVGSAVAIIMLIVLAIKYIAASPSDKAEIKKHIIVYVVGAIVLFGASTLVGMLATFTDSAITTSEKPVTYAIVEYQDVA